MEISRSYQSPTQSNVQFSPSGQTAVTMPKIAYFTPTSPAPQAPSSNTMQSLLGALQTVYQGVKSLSNFAGAQRVSDIGQGLGVVGGALQYGNQVMQAVQLFQAVREGGVEGALHSIGGLGQNYLLNQGLNSIAQSAGVEGLSSLLSGGAGATSATGAGAVAATEAGASELGALGGNVMGAAGALYSVYGLIDGWGQSSPAAGAVQGASAGAYIGSVIPGVGTAIGAVVGGVIGGLLGFIKTGKHQDQIARDTVREGLQKIGFVDKDWQMDLANGQKYDIGKDGGFRLQNVDGTERRAYEVDFKNPLAGSVVAMVNPIAYLLTGGDKKLSTDFAGYLTNAALSTGGGIDNARANVRAMVTKLQLSPEAAIQGLMQLQMQGKISPSDAQVYAHGIADIFKTEQ